MEIAGEQQRGPSIRIAWWFIATLILKEFPRRLADDQHDEATEKN